MNDGTISGNTAASGGGVNVASGGTFTMTGGTISGNTASGNGKGVYTDGTFSMSGSAVVAANNDVYLPTGKQITIAGALTPGLNTAAGSPAYSAAITPAAFPTTASVRVLAGGGTLIADNKGKFTNTNVPPWSISNTGYLVRGLTVNCSIEGIGVISFTGVPNPPYVARSGVIAITASGAGLTAGATWSVRMDGAAITGVLSDSTYTATIPAGAALGQKTITVFINTGGAQYSGSFQITVTQ
jgi:hypothetical protein